MSHSKSSIFVYIAIAAAFAFVLINIFFGIDSISTKDALRTSWLARKNCQIQLDEVQLPDGTVKYYCPHKTGPLTYENGEPIIDPRTDSPYIWASVDMKGNRSEWNPDDEIPRFFAHSEKSDANGYRWFLFTSSGGTQLLSDDEVNWEDHTAIIPLN